MADNVAITAGSGTTIATDDVSGVQYQRIKLDVGADGATTPVTAAAPLPVVQTGTPGLPTGASTAAKQPALGTAGTASADVITVQGIAAGTLLGVGGKQVNISQTPTVTSGAYAAEDAVGGLLTFANAARVSGGSGLVQGITILCKSPLVAATVPSLEVAFFNQTFTAMSDNGTWSPSDADMANFIGSVPISAWLIATTNVAATRFGLAFPFLLTGTSLFAQIITHTAVTLTSTSDIIIGVQIIQD